jgi:hypothetical protein
MVRRTAEAHEEVMSMCIVPAMSAGWRDQARLLWLWSVLPSVLPQAS